MSLITPNSIVGINSITVQESQPFSIYDVNGNVKLNINGTGSVSDTYGNLRSIPQNSKNASYTLVATDAGKHISTISDVTVPANVFNVGDVITIYNKNTTGTTITITEENSVTMYFSGVSGSGFPPPPTSKGNRTLKQTGIATILCCDVNTFVIYGYGLT